MKIQKILAERHKTHGHFFDNARFSQEVEALAKTMPSFQKLSQVQAESLKMIFIKIARILSGDPKHIDSWIDIQGFARLGGENKKKRSSR